MSGLTHLSAPIRVCQKEIKNRIVVPAMADFGMTGPDGLVNQRHIERYGAYARGGAGLIIIEACAVTKFPETRGTIGLYSDECLPGLEKLAGAATENHAASLVKRNSRLPVIGVGKIQTGIQAEEILDQDLLIGGCSK